MVRNRAPCKLRGWLPFCGLERSRSFEDRTLSLQMDAAHTARAHFEAVAPADLSGADSWNLTLSLEDGYTVVIR